MFIVGYQNVTRVVVCTIDVFCKTYNCSSSCARIVEKKRHLILKQQCACSTNYSSHLLHLPEQGAGYQISEHFPDSCGRHHQGNYNRENLILKVINYFCVPIICSRAIPRSYEAT